MPNDDGKTPVQPDTTEAGTTAQQVEPKTKEVNLENFVPKERFTGAIQKIQSQGEQINQLSADLQARASEIEQLKLQIAEKDAGSQTLLGQRDTKIGDLTTQLGQLEKELKAKQIDLMKVNIARELGQPQLINILDTIPSVEDPEQLKTMMQNIAEFAITQVKQREQELLSGETPGISSVKNVEKKLPTTAQGWESYLAGLDPYSKEYNDALAQWGEQLTANK